MPSPAAAGIERPDVVAATIGPRLAGALMVGWPRPSLRRRVGVPFTPSTTSAGTWPPTSTTMVRCQSALDCWSPAAHPPAARTFPGATHRRTRLHTGRRRGEAYDKIARLLGLGYPGGRALDELARTGDAGAIFFPRGMTGPRDDPYTFSFSGLKTAVARYVESNPNANPLTSPPGFRSLSPTC